MSTNLYELIDELCPDGVEYRALWEVCEAKRGFGLSKSIIGSGNTPVILYGQLYTTYGDYIRKIESFVDKSHVKPKSLIKRNSIVLPISSTTKEAVIGKPSVVKVEGCYLGSDAVQIIPTHAINSDFLMYVMHGYKFVHKKMKCVEGTTIRHLKVQKLMDIEVPVPPLPVQAEIVRILDKFTELIATLQKELELRAKQYSYYRDLLLSPEHLFEVAGEENVRTVELGEIITHLRTGLNPRKNFKLNTDDAQGYYVTVRELAGKEVRFSDKTDRVNNDALAKIDARSNLQAGDVLFSATGTIGNTALVREKPSNWNIKEGVYAITPDQEQVIPDYLLFWLHCTDATDQFKKASEGGTVQSVSMKKFKLVKIPLPPLPVQREIAQTLDKFDTLVNSLTQGIPAEIEGRKKQYAYYRDKLLDFKRLEK